MPRLPPRVVVEAPASSANLGAGFDVFALALGRPTDVLTLERGQSGIDLKVEGIEVPHSAEHNLVGAVAKAIVKGEAVRGGVSMTLRKGVPVGKGLGSSAASSAAAAVGMNSLFGLGLTTEELVRYAGLGEEAASGAAHYDNVAAAVLGGFVIVSPGPHCVKMEPPGGLSLVLVVPDVPLPKEKTKYARSLLPRSLPIRKVVETTGAASMMVHGFGLGSVEEIGAAMIGGFVDPSRSSMVPGFAEVRRAAMDAGAAGVCISGAGPSLLAATSRGKSKKVLKAMVGAFERRGIRSEAFSALPGQGCRVLGEK